MARQDYRIILLCCIAFIFIIILFINFFYATRSVVERKQLKLALEQSQTLDLLRWKSNISTVDPDFIGIVRLETGPAFTNNICTFLNTSAVSHKFCYH